MKKVVCIDDANQIELPACPKVKKGAIYTAVDVYVCPINKASYYVFLECGIDNGYHVGSFIDLIEDQIDETELVKERLTETV